MKAGILLVTHPGVGDSLIDTTKTILGELPLACISISPRDEETIEAMHGRAREALIELDEGAGILVLTDAYGATPGNLAVALGQMHDYPVVTGLNLPMLLRVMNYPYLPVTTLAEKAMQAAQESILQITDRGAEP